jgi:hypothetical protein
MAAVIFTQSAGSIAQNYYAIPWLSQHLCALTPLPLLLCLEHRGSGSTLVQLCQFENLFWLQLQERGFLLAEVGPSG